MFEISTLSELMDMRSLVNNTVERIKQLVREGYYVVLFLDFDFVIIDGRSEDIYHLVDRNLVKYSAYEKRMLLQKAYDGAWADVARSCGTLYQELGIITARSTFTSLRALNHVVHHGLNVSFHNSVGSQKKTLSYRIALEQLKREQKKFFVFMVDDGKHHCDDFTEVAADLGLSDCTEAIRSPQIRHYSLEDLQAHYEAVMDPKRKGIFILHEGRVPGLPGPRYEFVVCASGLADYRKAYEDIVFRARREAIVEDCRAELEAIARTDNPDTPITDERLYRIWELLQT